MIAKRKKAILPRASDPIGEHRFQAWGPSLATMPKDAAERLVRNFQSSLQALLPGLADADVAAAELDALLACPPIPTMRRAAAKAEAKKIRRHLEKIAELSGAHRAWFALFRRRHAVAANSIPGVASMEHLEPLIACVHMLQTWGEDGSQTILDLLEREIAAEIDAFPDTGSIKWPGVWAVDALIALWIRQKGGEPWTSVNWEGRRSRGAYLRAGYEFLGQAVELDGTVESAFNRWAEMKK